MNERLAYKPPKLEPHPWRVITGVSLPIGTLGFPDNPLDALELEEVQGE